MFYILGILFIRAYLLGVLLFFLASLSLVVFKPSKKSLVDCLKGLLVSCIWPLALFSKGGRAILFKAVTRTQR